VPIVFTQARTAPQNKKIKKHRNDSDEEGNTKFLYEDYAFDRQSREGEREGGGVGGREGGRAAMQEPDSVNAEKEKILIKEEKGRDIQRASVRVQNRDSLKGGGGDSQRNGKGGKRDGDGKGGKREGGEGDRKVPALNIDSALQTAGVGGRKEQDSGRMEQDSGRREQDSDPLFGNTFSKVLFT
jgi:hypothetical protein